MLHILGVSATTDILYNNSQNPTDDRHFVYDSVYPRMMAFDNGQGQTNLSYIPAGQPGAGKLAEESTPDGYHIDRRYDALGRLQGTDVVDLNNQSHPSALSYDELNRLVQNVTELGPFQYSYDHDSPRLSQLRYPNQTQTQYTYFDALGDLRLKTLNHLNPSDTLLAGHSYQYDAEGQIRQWQRLGSESISEAFSYDVIGQLRQVDVLTAGGKRAIPAVPGGKGQPATAAIPPKKQNGITAAFAYGYDAVGNRIQETVGTQTTAATYNGLNQLQTHGRDSYSHDDDGNQRERHSATLGSHSYLWDAENRLVAIEDLNNPATRSDLAYDALGRRIGIKDRNNGTTTKDARLIYCGTTLCAENDYLTNSFTRYYDDGAAIDGEGVYYHREHLGSVRGVTDAGGAIKAIYAYDPYGRRTTLTGNATDSAFGYTGHYMHQASGLALAPYRAYDANIGRWVSRDPIGEKGGINLYTYVWNNPVNYIDPFGLEAAVPAIPNPGAVPRSGVIPGWVRPPNPWWLLIWPRPAGEGSDIIPPEPYYNESSDDGDNSPKQCDDSSQRGNPYHGEPGTWSEHPHGKQDRLYGPDGTPVVDIDYGHDHGQGSPHSHNWDNGIRGPGVPVTVLPK